MLDQALIRSLNLSNHVIEHLIGKEEKEIERREALFRDGYPAQDLSGRTVILVDDGAATGATMLAAAETVRMQHAKEVVIAIPVASHMACSAFKSEAAKCIYLATPEPFYAVGRSYESFPQVGDEEVQALLSRARFHSSGIESPIRSSPTS
jgi:predicted phosphoribosyltransferase